MKRRKFLAALATGVAAVTVGKYLPKEPAITLGSVVESSGRIIAATNYNNGDVVTYILNGQKYWYRQSDLIALQKFTEDREKEIFKF